MKNLLNRLTRIGLMLLLLVDRTPNFGILANATYADLDVEVSSGSGSYVTENIWSLDKSVNTSTLNLNIGSNQNVTYTITATKSTKSTFTFDFSVTVDNDSKWHDAYFSLDARILKPNGSPLFNWKNIDSNVYIGKNTSVTNSYSETFEFIGALPSDILPFKIEVKVTAPGNSKTDKSPANNTLGSTILNNSLHVTDSFEGAGPWDFTSSGSVTYNRTIQSGSVGGTHTVVNTVYGDYLGITDSVTVTVNTLNAKPVANNQSLSTLEDTPLNIVLTGSDANPSQTLSFEVVGSPSNGTLSGTAPNLTYTPNLNYNGSDLFTFKVFDGFEYSSNATITIQVNPDNDLPVAVDDTASVDEDSEVDIDVVDNDTDIDGDSISVSSYTQPANGSVSKNPDGTLKYIPNGNFNGTDTFTYTINGGSSATVTVNVNPIDDSPVAVDDLATTDEDNDIDIDVLDNDTDIDGGLLEVISVGTPSNGVATINLDGTINYSPNTNFNGTDSFTYTINGGSSATVSITIRPVDDSPVAVDDTASVDEDSEVDIDVLDNDTDIDGGLLEITFVDTPSNGTVTENPDGTLKYVPDPDFNGSDTFTYTINGGSTATVTVTINPIDDSPVAVDDTATVDEDSEVDIDVLDNDTDVDGDAISIDSFTQPANGTVTENPDGTLKYVPDEDFSGTDTFEYTINGGDSASVEITVNPKDDLPVAVDDTATVDEDSEVDIDVLDNDTDSDGDVITVDNFTQPTNGTVTANPDGTLKYVPNPNYNGTDSFTYTINGGDSAEVVVTVNKVNDTPLGVDDTYNTNEDQTITVNASNGVLKNDTDIDGDSLIATKLTNPSNGTLLYFLNSGAFRYRPNGDFHGTDTFTYKVSDPSGAFSIATVTINVASVNDRPDADPDIFIVNEDTSLYFTIDDLLNNDSDDDNDPLEITSFSQPGAGSLTLVGNQFTFVPNPNFFGMTTFNYTISDGNGGTDSTTVMITVRPINDAPVAIDDTYNMNEDEVLSITTYSNGVLPNDYDVDSIILYSVLLPGGEPTNGTVDLNLNGTFTYTPNANFTGTDTFIYEVRDLLGRSDLGLVTINVAPINDAPVANNDTYSTNEDTQLDVLLPGILGNDLDVENDALTITLIADVTNGTLTLNQDGSFTYIPVLNFNGTDTFTYLINDGEFDSNVATVTLNVVAVNDGPIANPLAFTVANAGTNTGNLTATDIDVPADTLTFSLITAPVNGTVIILPNGEYSYTHNGSATLSDSFEFSVTDGDLSSTATVTITVLAINLSPVAIGQSFSVVTSGTFSGAVSGTDPETDPLVFSLLTGPVNGSLVFNSDGTYTYVHNGGPSTSDSFLFEVYDGSSTSNALVTITIIGLPTPPPPPPAGNGVPIANNGSVTSEFNEPISGNVTGSDPDDDPLTFSLVDGPNNGTLVFNPDGSFTYTPNEGFDGNDSFTFIANDGTDDSNIGTFTISVSEEEIIVVPEEETPLVALPFDWFSWLAYLLAGLLAWLLAFLRPNMKYTLTDAANNQKVIRRRISKPDEKTMLVELNDKDMVNLQTINVEFYKRLAKHCGDVTVNFQLNGKIIHSVIIPEGIDDSFETLIRL